jgi:hypothetical protein
MRAPNGTKTAPKRRTGFAIAVWAGTMASKRGRAMVTPKLRKNVRLGNDSFRMNITISF